MEQRAGFRIVNGRASHRERVRHARHTAEALQLGDLKLRRVVLLQRRDRSADGGGDLRLTQPGERHHLDHLPRFLCGFMLLHEPSVARPASATDNGAKKMAPRCERGAER